MNIHKLIDHNVKKSQRWWNAYVHIASFSYPMLVKLSEGSTDWGDDKEGLELAIYAMDFFRKDGPLWALSDEDEARVQAGCEWFGKNFARLWD
jgi:hypothetical protein